MSSGISNHGPKKKILAEFLKMFSGWMKMFTQQNLHIRSDRRRHCGGYRGSWQGLVCQSGASTSWWLGSSSCPSRGGAPGSHLGSCPPRGRPTSGGSRRLASTWTGGLGSGSEREKRKSFLRYRRQQTFVIFAWRGLPCFLHLFRYHMRSKRCTSVLETIGIIILWPAYQHG